MDIQAGGVRLENVTQINVLLGKNGAGKSTALRALDQSKDQLRNLGAIRYITPERGGTLTYEGSIETTLAHDPSWGSNVRRNNRFDNFRQMSVTEFRRLETLVLRKIEKDTATRCDLNFSFDTTMDMINQLLDQVKIVRSDGSGFSIQAKAGTEQRGAATLSSGESELISLAIEILSFAYSAETFDKNKSYLLLDEPDVHLHPDLQERLINLLVEAIRGKDIQVVIATHSTAILGALSENADASVGFICAGQKNVRFSPISDSLRAILPIFGAHPLSNVFNRKPILLVEGEDDERIWQQAVRSSNGKLKVWPCAAGDVQSLDKYEKEVEALAGSIYDNPVAFSLRDRDNEGYQIGDRGFVKRMRLNCRSAENLILSDDVLASLNTNWNTLQIQIDLWLQNFPSHPQANEMAAFRAAGYDRQSGQIKSLRNVFLMLTGSQKAWEVAVGQGIAKLITQGAITSQHSLRTYLGPKLIQQLGLTRQT